MTHEAELASLIAQYATLHRELRVARGHNDYNLDVVVEYACQDLLNLYRRCGTPQSGLETVRDEVAFEGEVLARLNAEAGA